MKRFKKWMSGILAVMLALVCFMPTPDVSANSTTDLSQLPVTSGEEVDYFPYFDQHASTPFGETEQELIAANGMFDADAAVEGDTVVPEATYGIYADENGTNYDAVKLVKGSVSWTLNLPADARYIVKITYLGEKSNTRDSSVCVMIDGTIPFDEANDITLERLWIDELKDGKIPTDNRGNNTIPKQTQVMQWNTMALQDYSIFTNDPLAFWFPAGESTFTIKNYSSEPLYVAKVELVAPETVLSDTEYKARNYVEGDRSWMSEHIQAEYPALKSSQSIYPTYDKSNPATEPYDSYLILRNTIGDANWSKPGEWLVYNVDNVPQDGLYYITLKYRQHQVIGSSTFRNIYVKNGENGSFQIPCAAYQNVAFPYNVNWKSQTIEVPVFLTKGHNEIKLQATVGKWADVLRVVEASNQRLNDMYIQIVMITGTTPDAYYDYNLQKEIPDLVKVFTEERDRLSAMADEFDRLNGGKSTQSETLRGAVNQLDSMLEEPDTIPQRLSAFRDTISTLSTWTYDNMTQSLEMDYILVHGADAQLPNPDANFWDKLVHFFVTFFQSFVMDYDMVGASGGGEGEAITVWISSGRDQASIMMDMITEDFTAKTGINVKISLVQTGFIEATLAGTGPDVAVGVSRGQPVNLACRGALIDLSKFDTYDEVVSRFSENATVPYEYNGGTYAIPNTQSYFMMFYRKDVIAKLGMTEEDLPQTWEDLLHLVPILQKKHMEVGLPYSLISAAAAVDLGMASKDIFPVLLLQNGGDVYNEAGTASALNSEAGMNAFKQWCEYYEQYGFELVYDFYTRFRNGDMPVGIADLGMYNTLIAGAPELRDKWGMAPIPGTQKVDADGNTYIDRSLGSTGSGVVMFRTERTTGKNADEHQQKCWEFIDWWTKAETQNTYNTQVENVMGPAGRNATANLEAFDMLPWKDEEKKALAAQRAWVKDLREVPGSYFVSRCIDNAFRAVIYDGENAREVFNREVQSINREIERKRKELGLN